jgi:hypothetical protein
MGVENFDKVAAAGQRQAKRARVLLSARLRTQHGDDIEARLRDLSQKGALIEFLRSIDESEVLVQLGRPVATATGTAAAGPQRFRRPRIGGEDMSENERKLVRNWGVAVGIAVAGD